MAELAAVPIVRWTVRYDASSDPVEIQVPHAWRQDVSVTFEGPVTYHAVIEVPRGESHLIFRGVSYAAEVYIEGESVFVHRGIWDAFAVPLSKYAGKSVNVDVSVVKNGGESYPVRDVASGFLPFVFNTFGGMFGEVELVRGAAQLDQPALPSRVSFEDSKIYVDGMPFYVRGLLHWGWYPELGHPNVPELVIRDEVQAARARGFNLVKFCLWVPPQRYLEILREEGMEAWLELPLWDPTSSPERQAEIAEELERIVRQYRRHDNIIIWTVGCELSTSTSPAYREFLTNLVRNLTGCPLVKDNSGGAEMYGGDLREYGTIYDFHPYCDLPFYSQVLDSLLPGGRAALPLLLGEYNDIDVHRDLSRLGDEMPYWASNLPELNDKGVRWQNDLPEVLNTSRFALEPTRSRHTDLMASSVEKALFIRKRVTETVRAREAISGYVITGWRDTPISSAGVFDDWGEARFTPTSMLDWNSEVALFLIPTRRPPWVNGGNRPGWIDPLNHFAGQVFWQIGIHATMALNGGLFWKVSRPDGTLAAHGVERQCIVQSLKPCEVGQISWHASPGEYVLEVEFAGTRNSWPIWIVDRPSWDDVQVDDPARALGNIQATADSSSIIATRWNPDAKVMTIRGEGTIAAPFWRESAYEFLDPSFWAKLPFARKWERLLPVSCDCVLNEKWLREKVGPYEVLLNRVDVRTYADGPILVKTAHGFITTLRPQGGLGDQPAPLPMNPAGSALLRCLVDLAS